jgi:hypothetical protein
MQVHEPSYFGNAAFAQSTATQIRPPSRGGLFCRTGNADQITGLQAAGMIGLAVFPHSLRSKCSPVAGRTQA